MSPWNQFARRRNCHQNQSQFLNVEACEQRMLLSGNPMIDIASIDGSGNNLEDPSLGSVGEQLLRLTTAEYGDGISTLAGEDRPSAREISNAVVSQSESITNDRHLTDYIWIWGQFIDHDIDLTEGGSLGEEANIDVPIGDPFFDPYGTGTQSIGLTRSHYDESTGTGVDNPRQQVNDITAFLDGSVIYGSDEERAAELRTFSDGKLKTSAGDLLPFNENGLPNAGGTSSSLFLAGDVRANENIALTSMHTIWVREHNRIAEELGQKHPDWNDEEIYQQARSLVRAELQAITYNEFLPALLGQGAIGAYAGYDAGVNPGIANVFSTAAYRLGHSLLSPELLRLNSDGSVADEGNIALQNAFFRPDQLQATGVDSLLQGAAAQLAQELDNYVIDDVRNFLFGPPGAGGFDLASLNIQRGRDHGLADYNQTRVDFGLSAVSSFEEISSNPDVVAALMSVYDSVDEIDVWVGMLAEDHVAGSSVGELMQVVLVDQFTRLRDGDRFWYQNILGGQALKQVEQTTLADVIERNSDVENLQANVFYEASVLYFKVPDNGRHYSLHVRVDRGNVEIMDRFSRQVLASQSAETVEQVIIVGRDGQRDRIIIDESVNQKQVSDGVVAWGGHGVGDSLTVEGTRRNDRIEIHSDEVDVNGQRLKYAGFEQVNVMGGSGNDRISAGGRYLNVTLNIYGGHGNDKITGSSGNDRLFGEAGNDRIEGLAGNDLIVGGSGNDYLLGGEGRDRIIGGPGRDSIEQEDRKAAKKKSANGNPGRFGSVMSSNNDVKNHNDRQKDEEKGRTSSLMKSSSKTLDQFEQLGAAVLKNLFQHS